MDRHQAEEAVRTILSYIEKTSREDPQGKALNKHLRGSFLCSMKYSLDINKIHPRYSIPPLMGKDTMALYF